MENITTYIKEISLPIISIYSSIMDEIYETIDIDYYQKNLGVIESDIKKRIIHKIPIIKEEYLLSFRQISSTGEKNYGIYISDNDPSKLIKCIVNDDELLYYLIIQKMIKHNRLPSDIIPKLYSVHRDSDNKFFYITLEREHRSICDYVFETYIPRKLQKKFGKRILNIYKLMLPRTMTKPNLFRFSDYDIPFVTFLELDDDELKIVDELLKKYIENNKRDMYSLLEISFEIHRLNNEQISNKFYDGLIIIITIFKTMENNRAKPRDAILSEIGISYTTLANNFIQQVRMLKYGINTIKKMFCGSEVKFSYLDYENFIKYELSNDLENKLRSIRYQIYIIDMHMLEVCNLYQTDRKMDNWLVKLVPKPKEHLNIKPEQLSTEFDDNECVYIKISDLEGIIYVKPEDIDIYKNKIGKQYFELGKKLGQYHFDYIGQKMINNFYKEYLQTNIGIDKNIVEILSRDFKLMNLTDIDGKQIYDLLKTNIL